MNQKLWFTGPKLSTKNFIQGIRKGERVSGFSLDVFQWVPNKFQICIMERG